MKGGPAIPARLSLIALAVLLLSGCSPSPTGTGENSYTIAFLRAVPDTGTSQGALLATLRMEGYVIGTNLTVLGLDTDETYPDEASARTIVDEWSREGVDLIVATSTVGARAASEEAPQVNVLFLANDPIATGLIESAERPEGSLTGVTFRVPADRTLDLIRRAIPGQEPIGLVYPPSDPAAVAHRDEVLSAAEELGLPLILEPLGESEEVSDAVARLAEQGVGSLLLSTSPTATRLLEDFREAAISFELPVVANTPVAPWATMSLYPDAEEIGHQMGRQAIRLLSGSSPAAIPVEDPRRLVLQLNAGAAAEHGIEFSDTLMREADMVEMP